VLERAGLHVGLAKVIKRQSYRTEDKPRTSSGRIGACQKNIARLAFADSQPRSLHAAGKSSSI
jgi:hypothetical protein